MADHHIGAADGSDGVTPHGDSGGSAVADRRHISDRLRRERRRWIDEVLSAVGGETDIYASLPSEELRGDIADTIARNLDLFAASLRSDRRPSADDLEEIRNSAARRAEEGIPLEMVVRVYLIAARVVYHAIVGDSSESAAPTTVRLLGFLEDVMSAAVDGYLTEYQLVLAETQFRQGQFLDGLIEPTRFRRDSAGVLPAAFHVLAMHIAPHPDELSADVNADVAARRKLRRVRSTMIDDTPDVLLTSLAPDGGIALIPDPGQQRDVRDLELLVGRIERAAEAPVTVAWTSGVPTNVASSVEIAGGLLDLAVALRRPPGLYRLEDLHFEYQLTRPGAARDALLSTLRPLTDEPDLVVTLRSYLSAGHNRRQTAVDLGVHPNTVDNRLRRIATLIAIDPTDTAQAARLEGALIVLDLERSGQPSSSASPRRMPSGPRT